MDTRTFNIAVSGEDLATLRNVVDESLRVPSAMASEGEVGRENALEKLTGKKVMRDQAPGNVVKRIDLGVKKKRTGRPCGWPSLREDRARVNERMNERRAQGLPSPFDAGRLSVDGSAYIPSRKEEQALRRIRSEISQQLAIDPTELSVPKAVVSCVAPDTEAPRPLHRQAGLCIQVAVNGGDSKVEVMTSTGAEGGALQQGEVFAFDARQAHRMPMGDYNRELFFTAKGDPI